jgi:hypothetical protein
MNKPPCDKRKTRARSRFSGRLQIYYMSAESGRA